MVSDSITVPMAINYQDNVSTFSMVTDGTNCLSVRICQLVDLFFAGSFFVQKQMFSTGVVFLNIYRNIAQNIIKLGKCKLLISSSYIIQRVSMMCCVLSSDEY